MKQLKVWILFGVIMFSAGSGQAQSDDAWWNQQQNWDGVTSWVSYMIYSPAYMGPNALPVPFSEKGIVGDRAYVRVYSDYYHQQGDVTYDGGIKLYVPVVPGKIAVEGWGVAMEHYRISESLSVERRARHQNPEGIASGDAYFATVISILKDKPLDVALRIGLRTASGGKLSDARYTDAPGYFFDVSAGKQWFLSGKQSLRIHAMLGFYSWQTNMPDRRQDDAELFGVGVDYQVGTFKMETSVDGYSGYLGNKPIYIIDQSSPLAFRDRPIVFRFGISKTFHQWEAGMRYQAGLQDFEYKSVRVWIGYYLPRKGKHQK